MNDRSGYRAHEIDAMSLERMLAQPLAVSCGKCEWTAEGAGAEVLELAKAHRREHGFRKANGSPSRKHVRNLRSFKSPELTEADRREIAEEIRRRARLHGLEMA